jgi:FAD/FMN-containing dehydrogenase
VTVLRARLKLIPVLAERSLVVLGYPSVEKAADAIPAILPHKPIALEGLDDRLLHDQQVKRLNSQARQELPRGSAYLMVQFGADTREEADQAGKKLTSRWDGSRTRHGSWQQPERAGSLMP